MNNNSSFFYILCRLKKIFRWNGTNVVETDNVMEHSYRVMVISYLLYVIRRKEKLDKENRYDLYSRCLTSHCLESKM